MPRYIDADKLIDLATHEEAYGYVDVHDILNIPTADVVERKKGKWIEDGYLALPAVCSCCGEQGQRFWKFCPYCGADMRGDGDGNVQ